MATLYLSQIVLKDNWPGVPNPTLSIPDDGFDSTRYNFNTADHTQWTFNPPYRPGEKIQVYTDQTCNPGFYTMIYLARHDGSSNDISSDISTGQFFVSPVGPLGIVSGVHCLQGTDSTKLAPWYLVQSCVTGLVASNSWKQAPVAVACTTTDADSSVQFVTDGANGMGYGHAWGWYWCGGVCPIADISFYRGGANSMNGACITVQSTVPRGILLSDWTAGTFLPGCDPTAVTNDSGPKGMIMGYACASAA